MVTDTHLATALRTAVGRRVVRKQGVQHRYNCTRVAIDAGISRVYLTMILTGRNSPIGMLLRLAQMLDVPIEISIDGRRIE